MFVCLFLPHCAACRILVPRPGPVAVKAQSPNQWTAREFPRNFLNVPSVVPLGLGSKGHHNLKATVPLHTFVPSSLHRPRADIRRLNSLRPSNQYSVFIRSNCLCPYTTSVKQVGTYYSLVVILAPGSSTCSICERPKQVYC